MGSGHPVGGLFLAGITGGGKIDARVSTFWTRYGSRTRVNRLTVSGAPVGATVTVTCKGKGCAFKRLVLPVKGATLALAATGLLSWVVFGIAFGTLVAWRRSRAGNAGLLAFSILGASVPTFWIGVLFLWLFGVQLRWFPVGGYGSWRHLVLPTLTLAVSGVATYARLAHAHLEAALQQDYLRTARAKGLPERRVMLRHALPNALLPLVTLAGSDLAVLIGGVVFTESVFNWPGIGRLAVERMSSLDIPVLMGIVLVTASTVVIVNLVLDLIYPLLDPRIRGEGERSPPA